MPMLQIGGVAFSVAGPHYDKLKHAIKFAWARQKRVGRADALQYTGIAEEEVSVSGTIYTDYFPGFGALGQLRGMGREPQTLVSGAGDVFGRWCILEVANEQTYQDRDGRPRKVTFDLKLERYGEDGAFAGLGAVGGLARGLGLPGVGGLTAAITGGLGVDVPGRLSQTFGWSKATRAGGRLGGVATAGVDVGAASVQASVRLF